MKKLIVLLGLSLAFGIKAETFEKTLMEDYTPVANMDFAFEIKTARYEKVILDCQSFITGINFYKNKKVIHSIYLDAYGDCQNMHDYLNESKQNKEPVCLELDVEKNALTVSHDSEGCQ
jgi:hypothetical protein